MSQLVNLKRFGFTEKEIKIIVEYLAIDKKLNKELINKIIKFGNYLKKSNNSEK